MTMRKSLCILIIAILLCSLFSPVCFAAENDISAFQLEPGDYIVGEDIPQDNYNITAFDSRGNGLVFAALMVLSQNNTDTYMFKSISDTNQIFLESGSRIHISGAPLVFSQGAEIGLNNQLLNAEAIPDLTDDEKTIAMVLKVVPQIVNVAIATEENDPWDGLHKSGSYQALVFFTLVYTDDSLTGPAIVAQGNRAGGCVELYEDEQHAINRDEYLKTFDGQSKLLNPGSHTVYNSFVIRTSPTLTASQQKEVEESIIAVLEAYEAGALCINLNDYANVVLMQSVQTPAPTPMPTPALAVQSEPKGTQPAELRLGEAWVVEGQWELTITGITETPERNQYTEKNPAAVYIIDYSYKNLGYENTYSDGLSMYVDNTIVDAANRMGYSYPGTVSRYPQEAPIGAICDAQACVGVDNAGSMRISVTKTDGNGMNQKAIFILDENDIVVKAPEPTLEPIPEPTPVLTPEPTPAPTSASTSSSTTETVDFWGQSALSVTGTDKVIVTDWALIEDDYDINLVMAFKNISGKTIPDFEVEVLFYDSDGNIIDQAKDGHDVVLPGATVVSRDALYNNEVLQYSEVEVIIDTEKYTNRYKNHTDNLSIKTNTSGKSVFLTIVNNDSVEIDEIEIVVVYYDKNGKIIGSAENEIRSLASGRKTVMEFSGYDSETVDHFQYYVNQAHTF